MNALISLRSFNNAAVAGAVLLCAAAIFAQDDAMSPYQNERDGVSAGGKWMQFESQDKMTGAKRVRFELLADNYFREDPEYKPRVELFCEAGKLKLADFNPGVRLARPNRPVAYAGQPQLEVEVESTTRTAIRAGTGSAATSSLWIKERRAE